MVQDGAILPGGAVVTIVGFVLASGEFPNAVSVAGGLLQGVALIPLARLAMTARR